MIQYPSRVAQILDLRASCTREETERLTKTLRLAPRAIALALIRRGDGRALVGRGLDRVNKEVFYRPLGGGVAFGEPGASAVVRELREETGLDVVAHERLAVFENIFVLEGARQHEIVFVFRASLRRESDYGREEVVVDDGGEEASRASWKNLDDIAAEGARLLPEGLMALMGAAGGGQRPVE